MENGSSQQRQLTSFVFYTEKITSPRRGCRNVHVHVRFTDETEQIINLKPVLAGELYGPLLDLQLFNQVAIDSEVKTLVWPNGADFDPATLHDWPEYKDAFAARAREWERVSA